jgi:hypothetical protein
MNYIKHLSGFFDKVANDKTLNPTHVSLYMSLFQFWNCNRFKNPISISRDEVMRISKISSKATYHKCLKNLHALGYINYEPSHNPFKGSHVYLFNFSDELKPMLKKDRNLSSNSEPVFGLVTEQVIDKPCTSIETSTEQALVSYTNNTNIPNISNNLNISNLDEQAKKNEKDDNVIARNEAISKKIKEEKSSAKKEEKEMPEQLLLENQKIVSPAFAVYNAKHTENSRQKSSAKKEEKEMLEQLLLENQKKVSPVFDDYNAKHTENSRQKSSAKKEKEEMPKQLLDENQIIVSPAFADYNAKHTENSRQKIIAPKMEEVKSYFLNQHFPELEANKFFHYFSSVGWLVGGKTPMVDWQAAAQNWILNAPKFKQNTDTTPIDRAKHLNVANDKNYAEPL